MKCKDKTFPIRQGYKIDFLFRWSSRTGSKLGKVCWLGSWIRQNCEKFPGQKGTSLPLCKATAWPPLQERTLLKPKCWFLWAILPSITTWFHRLQWALSVLHCASLQEEWWSQNAFSPLILLVHFFSVSLVQGSASASHQYSGIFTMMSMGSC